jgi:actin related protein 2/3 complex, subunit 2
VSDFDGVTFHISTPESKSKIVVSIQVKCFNELLKYGAQQVLEREYGPYVVAPENGYNFSVPVDLDNLPEDKGKKTGAWMLAKTDIVFNQKHEMI